MKHFTELYAAIGKLFYSVAYCDKSIRDIEEQTMIKHIDQHWLTFQHPADQFGTKSAHYISFAFETSKENGLAEQTAYQQFVDHYQENPEIYDDEVKSLIVKTATDMASAFKGNNKAELSRLAQIQFLLSGTPKTA